MQLTEKMILSKSNENNLAAIQKISLWGYDLTDVSMLEKLPSLEVLDLSQNQISSLKQLQRCFRLQELYLRFNNIQDLDELVYLKNFPLKHLVLAGNPCCKNAGENYRVSVIKMLPFLESLDNLSITPAELETALSFRVLERNMDNQNPNQQIFLESPLTTQRGQKLIESNQLNDSFTTSYGSNRRQIPTEDTIYSYPNQFGQQEDGQYGNLASMQHLSSRHSFPQSGALNYQHYNSNSQFALERFSLPEGQRHQSRRQNFQRDNYGNYHRSNVDLSEWERQQQFQGNDTRVRTVSSNVRPGLLTDRAPYRFNDDRTSDQGYISPHSNVSSINAQCSVSRTRAPIDTISVESSRSSSIASSNQSKIIYQRSRRVNLLCASLRFILELDVLSLVDVLSTIRSRINELCAI